MTIFTRVSNSVMIRFLSTQDLQEVKESFERDLRDARLGVYLNNEEAIADCEREILNLNKEIERRGRFERAGA